jgi:hypothetical protein
VSDKLKMPPPEIVNGFALGDDKKAVPPPGRLTREPAVPVPIGVTTIGVTAEPTVVSAVNWIE